MDRQEILAVTESDIKNCEAINKAVSEKLGLCWHESPYQPGYLCYRCSKCGKEGYPDPPLNPDYTHNIKTAWAIKEWLDRQLPVDHLDFWTRLLHLFTISHGADTTCEVSWASPLDRCKAFLLMDSDN